MKKLLSFSIRISILLIIFTIIIEKSFSQTKDLLRKEIEANVKSDEFYVVPVKETGVIIFSEGDESVKQNKVKSDLWVVTLYDTEFNQEWQREVPIAEGLKLVDKIIDDDYLYLAFDQTGPKKNTFQAVKIGVKEGDVKIVTGEAPNSVLNIFSVNNGKVFLGGATTLTGGQRFSRIMVSYCACFIPVFFGYLNPPSDPLLYHIDFSKSKVTNIHPKDKGCLAVTDINALKSSKQTEVLTSIMLDKKKKQTGIVSRVYDDNGEFIREYTIKSKLNNLLSKGFVSENNGIKYIIGTYKKSIDKSNKDKYKTYGSGDNGVYFTVFNEKEKQKFIKFYEFTKFDGFEGFVNKGVNKKIKKSKKGKSSKKNILLGYNLLVHKPIYTENEILTISEAYYAEYHTESRCCDSQGRSYTVSVFDGWRTTHALVASFDYEGELLWSTTFAIGTLSFDLKRRIRVLPQENRTVLAFNYDGTIYTKAIINKEVVDESTVEIETNFGSDKVKSNYKSDMEYWYDNYYIAYGYQKIKKDKGNKNKDIKKKRKVFYFNKIQVD